VGHGVDLDAVTKRKKSCHCRESNQGRPVRSVVTILTELSWLSVDGFGIYFRMRLKVLTEPEVNSSYYALPPIFMITTAI
jgi:hypothetical protein